MPLPKYNGRNEPWDAASGWATRRALVLLLLGGLVPAAAHGQRVLGPWDDATIPPRGMVRAGIGVHFGDWSRRFDADGERLSLGAPLTLEALGPSIFPALGSLEPDLAELTGAAPGTLSLGTLRTRVDVTEARTPITLEYGVTSRLGLQAVIPYVKNRVHVSAVANAGSSGATLGLNPAWSFGGARDLNSMVVTELATAAGTLEAELARCDGSTDPTCDAVNADRPGASTLVVSVQAAAAALANVYGTAAVNGSGFAPLAGSDLNTAVGDRLTALNDALAGFLGAAPGGAWIPTRPVPAALLAAADLDRLVGDSAYGIAGRPLADYEHSHVGDIELAAKVLLVDTFGPGPTTADLPRAGALRLAVGASVHLPTAQPDLPHDFTDIGTGDRQLDFEFRGHVDLALGRRFWASTVIRLALQQPDELVRRITDASSGPLPELVREQRVTRDLGDWFEAEVAPRWVPNDAFSVSALYRYRSKGADAYEGSFDVISVDGTPLSLDASTLDLGTSRTEQVLGLALTLSSVRGYALREARWPLEVSLVHTRVLRGEGAPDHRSTGVAVRLYRPVRANPLRPTGR